MNNIITVPDVNRHFIDGYFVGQFIQKLEENTAELK